LAKPIDLEQLGIIGVVGFDASRFLTASLADSWLDNLSAANSVADSDMGSSFFRIAFLIPYRQYTNPFWVAFLPSFSGHVITFEAGPRRQRAPRVGN
jgi:hypothetical protein